VAGPMLSKRPGGDQKRHIIVIYGVSRGRIAECLKQEYIIPTDVASQADAGFTIGELKVDVFQAQQVILPSGLGKQFLVPADNLLSQVRARGATGDHQPASRRFHPLRLLLCKALWREKGPPGRKVLLCCHPLPSRKAHSVIRIA
jgi:hypothetical protein